MAVRPMVQRADGWYRPAKRPTWKRHICFLLEHILSSDCGVADEHGEWLRCRRCGVEVHSDHSPHERLA